MKDFNTLKDIEILQQCELEDTDHLDNRYELLKNSLYYQQKNMMKLSMNFQMHLFICILTKVLSCLSIIRNRKSNFLYALLLVF